jgi:hypothetical protein
MMPLSLTFCCRTLPCIVSTCRVQFSEDDKSVLVGEAWAGRVTQWLATTGEFQAVVGAFQYPMEVQLCRSGSGAAVVVAEYTTARLGEPSHGLCHGHPRATVRFFELS